MIGQSQYILTLIKYRNAFIIEFGKSWYLSRLGQAIERGEQMLREFDIQFLREKHHTTIRKK